MKTQKIVLALALVAVTPAVLAAQENGNAYNKSTNEVIASNNQETSSLYTGPGSKIGYIADNALTRIRKNRQTQEQQKFDTVKTKQNDTINTPAYYPYGGPEGHMLVRENLKKPNTDTVKYKATGSYQYTGPEGHRAALGNARWEAKHEKQEPTTAPSYVRDIDTLSTNHQVILNSKTADKSARNTNKTFRHYLNEIGQAIAQEARYSK